MHLQTRTLVCVKQPFRLHLPDDLHTLCHVSFGTALQIILSLPRAFIFPLSVSVQQQYIMITIIIIIIIIISWPFNYGCAAKSG